ncbi:HAD family phosphatase [Nocardioides sp. zg-1228]|uniref:HAD family hydrolase n=1 Tax=Nocardioides sp. zg-1228 TaxID=2763008 RepID=UPI001642F766|nr:HAD family phosphatase [Nocardioides sp. zg-1228]MBC2932862.1 HAD family phosphatase [Nocardioides sp. zg-1228]QSF56926.1 HAD family phosphatase [Nocardioides sp. zg-1228]
MTGSTTGSTTGSALSGFLLDLDGTLVDSESLHRASYEAWFAHRGWELPDLAMFTGRRAEDVFAVEPGPWSGHDPVALAREVVPFVPDEPPTPVLGARDLLLGARATGVPLAIVTSAGPDWVERSLRAMALDLDSVDVVVTSRDVADGKPHPAGYALACERLHIDPAHALAAEDSPAGVRAARGAGVRRVVGVATTHLAARLEDAGATEVHDDLRPLLGLVARG